MQDAPSPSHITSLKSDRNAEGKHHYETRILEIFTKLFEAPCAAVGRL